MAAWCSIVWRTSSTIDHKGDNLVAGTKEGGAKVAATNKEKHGADYYKKIGAMGGAKKVAKGFACMSPEKRSAAGAKGGRISRRTKT